MRPSPGRLPASQLNTAVALRFGSTLVTLDREQRQRVAPVIPSCLPADPLGDAGS